MSKARKIIGLAGPIASGKNIVANFLQDKEFSIIDVDKLGHIALEESKGEILSLFGAIAQTRGLELLDENGNIHRRNLAKIVFSNKKNLKKHESVLHPKMNALIEQELSNHSSTNYVINAAILHKFSVIKQCDMIIFVTAKPFLRFKRAKKRSNISKMQFFKTFLSQIEIYSKCKKLNADIYRVDNSDTQELLVKKITQILDSCI